MAGAVLRGGLRAGVGEWLSRAHLVRPGGQWAIGVYEGPTPTALHPSPGVRQPVLTGDDIRDVDAAFVADPFAVRRDDGWYLFMEILDRDSGRGVIGYAHSEDFRKWEYGGVVLREPQHLSYPCVVAGDGGELCMIPETSSAEEVCLYSAGSFPERWEKVGVLLQGLPYSDATPLKHNGHWYLFVETQTGRYLNTLRLYHASRLEGPWTAHPASPLYEEQANLARPAGPVVRVGDDLVRFSQDCYPRYGTAVRATRILELSPETFEEVEVSDGPVIGATDRGWNGLGMHHVDAHAEDGRWIAVVDGLSRAHVSLGWYGNAH